MKIEKKEFSYPEESVYYVPVGSMKQFTPYDFYNGTDSDALLLVSATVPDKPYIVFMNETFVVPANELISVSLNAFGLCSPSTSTACWAINSSDIKVMHTIYYMSPVLKEENASVKKEDQNEIKSEEPPKKRFRRPNAVVRAEKERKLLEMMQQKEELEKSLSQSVQNEVEDPFIIRESDVPQYEDPKSEE